MSEESTVRSRVDSYFASDGERDFRVDAYTTPSGARRCRITRIGSHAEDFAVAEGPDDFDALCAAFAAYQEKPRA